MEYLWNLKGLSHKKYKLWGDWEYFILWGLLIAKHWVQMSWKKGKDA
jgi:hypothetical protein